MTHEKLVETVREVARQHNDLEEFVGRLEERFKALDHFVSGLETRVTILERFVTGTEDGREGAPQPFMRESDVRRILWQTGRTQTTEDERNGVIQGE
jgi:hypothetical protein